MKTFQTVSILFPLLALPASATVIWTGATSNDPFEGSNWDFTSSTASAVDSNVSVADDLTITNGNVEIPNLGGQVRLQVANGFSLTLNNSILGLVAGGNDGVGGEPGGTGMVINVTNGSQLNAFFVVNGADVQVDGTSSVTLGGGGNPVNFSTINLTSGSVLSFSGETPAAFTTEHLTKITVDGAAAVDGVNINVATFNGASGSQVTVIPEPSHVVLLGLGGLLGFVRRRR
ncbi:MAG: PEP-CTERM sorting domain-containing protein [Akkermansiaceae bacterium]|jgi:hypothetical protein|nr:PEP-CTERM sorting domain-containing protein [Akkermansiaceae bacterium]